MKLYVMRHGPAMPRGSVPDEFSRPLSPEGVEQTAAAARGLARLGLSGVRILSSPLTRALQTADLVAAELAPGGRPESVDLLAAGASPGEIRKALKGSTSDTLIVGHDPDVSVLVGYLLSGEPQAFIDFSTGGVVALQFPDEVQKAAGRLLWYLRRRQLELLGGVGQA